MNNPNSHNVMRNNSKSKNVRIDVSKTIELDKAFSQDILDDTFIKSMINPKVLSGATSSSYEESSEYLQLRMREKLTVNLI